MGVFFWKSEKTEQKVKIDLQSEQNKYRIESRYQKWYKFLRAQSGISGVSSRQSGKAQIHAPQSA
jgi:hypothetical protein